MKNPCFDFFRVGHRLSLWTCVAVFASTMPSLLTGAETRWIGGASGNFETVGNYDNGSPNAKDVIFDGPLNLAVEFGGAVNLAVNSLHILNGSDGFSLSSAAGRQIVVHDGGVKVAANTRATINLALSVNGNATGLYFDVGTGGVLELNGQLTTARKVAYKRGEGTLTINAGTADFRSGSGFAFEEGKVIVGDGAILAYGSTEPLGTPNMLPVSLGTATKTAELSGGGSILGRLTTAGASQSRLTPSGDGTLEIANLNAQAGATFRFELGSSLIYGSGTMTGSLLPEGLQFEFSGGEAGVAYTLFDYGSLVNFDPDAFRIVTDGYVVDSWTLDTVNGRLQVEFSAVPEPELAWMASAILLAGWACRRYGRREQRG